MILLILVLISVVNSHQYTEINEVIDTIKSNSPKVSHIDLSQIELTLEDIKNIENSLQYNNQIGFIQWPFDASKSRGELLNYITNIHQGLRMNNLRFTRFPNDLTILVLNIHTNHVDNCEENQMILFDDEQFIRLNQYIFEWKLEKLFRDEKNGYQARLYFNRANGQFVLIHKNLNKNLLTKSSESFKESFKNLSLSHIFATLASTKESIQIAKKEMGFILFSGYSFGAWLAELSLLFSSCEFNYKQSRAVVFESPGALEVLEYWKLKKNIRHIELNFDLVNYILFPNNLNTLGGNAGKIYQISNQEKENLFPFFGENLMSYFEAFNEFTNLPHQIDHLKILNKENFYFESNYSGDPFQTIVNLPKFDRLSSYVDDILQDKFKLIKTDQNLIESHKIDYFSNKLYPHLNLIDKYLIKIFELRESQVKNMIFKEYVENFKQMYSVKSNFFEYTIETIYQHNTVEQVKEYLYRTLTVANDFKLLLSLESKKNLKPKLLSKYPDEEKNSIQRTDLIEALERKFTSYQIVVLYSAKSNGKTSLANLYTHKKLSDFGLIWWFQGNSIESEIRSFFNLCLKLKIWKYEKNILIKEAKRIFLMFKFNVLFVFDDLNSFEKIEDYIYDLPSNFKILITTKEKKFVQIFDKISLKIDGFSLKETNEYFRKYLPDSFSETDDSKLLFEVSGETVKDIQPGKLNSIMSHLKIDNSISIKEFIYKGKEITNIAIFDLIKNISPKRLRLLEYLSFLNSDFVWIDLICDLMNSTKIELRNEIDYLADTNMISIQQVDHLFGIQLKNSFREDLRKISQNCKEILKNLIQTLNKYFKDIYVLNDVKLTYAKLVYPHLTVLLNSVNHQVFIEETPEIFVELLSKLSFYEAIINIDYSKSIEYERVIIEKFDQNQTLVSESIFNIGKYFRRLNDLKNALEYLQKSLDIQKNSNLEDSYIKTNNLREIGLVYIQLGEFKTALEYFVKSLEISKNLKNEESIGESLMNIGFAHLNLEMSEKFLTFFNESVSNFLNYFQYPIKRKNFLSIMVILKFYISTENYQIYFNFFSKNFELLKTLEDEIFEKSELVFNLAEKFLLTLDNSNYKIIFDDKLLDIYKDFNPVNDKISAITLTNIGILYFISKNYEKSAEIFEKSLEILKNIKSKPDENLYYTYQVLARSYENSNKLLKSFNCYINSLGMRFKIFNLGDALKKNIFSLNDLFRLYLRSFMYQIIFLIIFNFLKFYYGKKLARMFVSLLVFIFFLVYYFS